MIERLENTNEELREREDNLREIGNLLFQRQVEVENLKVVETKSKVMEKQILDQEKKLQSLKRDVELETSNNKKLQKELAEKCKQLD